MNHQNRPEVPATPPTPIELRPVQLATMALIDRAAAISRNKQIAAMRRQIAL
jgi:hypothetical protein